MCNNSIFYDVFYSENHSSLLFIIPLGFNKTPSNHTSWDHIISTNPVKTDLNCLRKYE